MTGHIQDNIFSAQDLDAQRFKKLITLEMQNVFESRLAEAVKERSSVLGDKKAANDNHSQLLLKELEDELRRKRSALRRYFDEAARQIERPFQRIAKIKAGLTYVVWPVAVAVGYYRVGCAIYTPHASYLVALVPPVLAMAGVLAGFHQCGKMTERAFAASRELKDRADKVRRAEREIEDRRMRLYQVTRPAFAAFTCPNPWPGANRQ